MSLKEKIKMFKRFINSFKFNETQIASCTLMSILGIGASLGREPFSWIAFFIGALIWPTFAVVGNFVTMGEEHNEEI